MKKIPLIPIKYEQFALVDDDDYQHLIQNNWYYLEHSGYVGRQYQVANKRFRVMLQNEILPKKEGFVADHIDRDPLNNQKSNLRYATAQQNNWNTKSKGGASKYKGVSWISKDKIWRTMIVINKRNICIGNFENEIDAALAFDYMARKFRGDFSYLNFPEIFKDLKDLPGHNKKLFFSSSIYRGITKRDNVWQAFFPVSGTKKKLIGTYDDEIEAARAYDSAVKFYHGDKAKYNFLDTEPKSLEDLRKESVRLKGKPKKLGLQ